MRKGKWMYLLLIGLLAATVLQGCKSQKADKPDTAETQEAESKEAQHYTDNYALYEERGADAIAGRDYCRALNLMSYFYVAGYYDLSEALDKSLEIAQTVQPLYESWDELVDSYMCGYEYWQGDSSAERRAVYEELKG